MDAEPLEELSRELGGTVDAGPRTTVLKVTPDKVAAACQGVASMAGFYHLSTITGVDAGDSIDLLYHFWQGRRFIEVRTSVPKSSAKVASISDALPAATLYEAEIQDLLGVAFEGNPYLGKKLLLPDDYPPDAPPPLRSEADPEKIRKMMNLE